MLKMNEIIFSLCLIFMAIFIFIRTAAFPLPTREVAAIAARGPGWLKPMGWPCAKLLAVSLIIKNIHKLAKRKIQKEEKAQQKKGINENYFKVFLLLSIIVGYCIGLIFLGYVLATIIFLVITMSLIVEKINFQKLLLYMLPLSFVIATLTYLIFHVVIKVPLPKGILMMF